MRESSGWPAAPLAGPGRDSGPPAPRPGAVSAWDGLPVGGTGALMPPWGGVLGLQQLKLRCLRALQARDRAAWPQFAPWCPGCASLAAAGQSKPSGRDGSVVGQSAGTMGCTRELGQRPKVSCAALPRLEPAVDSFDLPGASQASQGGATALGTKPGVTFPPNTPLFPNWLPSLMSVPKREPRIN